MLETVRGFLIAWDNYLFVMINQVWVGSWGNGFFPFITNLMNQDWFRFIALPLMLLVWFLRERKNALKIALVLSLLAGLTDATGHRILKPNFDRTRPNNQPELHAVVRLPHQPGNKSFPSNHAMSCFAQATVLSWFYPHWMGLYFLIAGLVAYSRVYVGVHYVSDVVAGAILGYLIGRLVIFIVLTRFQFFIRSRKK